MLLVLGLAIVVSYQRPSAVAPALPDPPIESAVLSQLPDGQDAEVHSQGGPHLGLTSGLSSDADQPRPTWVRSIRETTLWSGPDQRAVSFNRIPEQTYLRVMGAGETRLFIFYDGDSAERIPGYAWVDAADVVASGPPANSGPTALTAKSREGLVADSAVPPPTRIGNALPPDITAESAVVVDERSGAVLYDLHAHRRMAPASVTKIATAIVALENGRLSDRVVSKVDSRRMPGSTVMGLEPGEVISLETLLFGLMLPSGNDAALAIADHVGGTRARFVAMMNAKAEMLGLRDTHFANPHGLDADGHYSSAYDMVMFARYGMQYPIFQKLSAAKEWRGEGYSFTNLNKLLWRYEGADGVKVGYTDAAGRTIVASAVRDGHRVYVGLMRSVDLVYDSTLLFDWAFENFRWPD